ncbi:contact-dependent growth inhibition system immunity protein [Myroides sp. C4067]|uniref:contact-dependent growth inhibition system immunity protein n=1 Tax=Myroides sp. C4067 TaxID=3136765 RepID=UPI003100F2D2
MKQLVDIILFKDKNKYIVYPFLIVKDSFNFTIPPFTSLENPSIRVLLDTVLYTLSFSKEGKRPEGDLKKMEQEFLEGIGVKTMAKLYKNSILLSVSANDTEIVFSAMHNKGSRHGFIGLEKDENIIMSKDSSREELEKALELALSRCI